MERKRTGTGGSCYPGLTEIMEGGTCMTKEELLAPFQDVPLKLVTDPVKDDEICPGAYEDTVNAIYRKEPCTSNRLGTDDESILECLCYDAG